MTDHRQRKNRETRNKRVQDYLHGGVSRRRFLELMAVGGTALVAGCVPATEPGPTSTTPPALEGDATAPPLVTTPGGPRSYRLPSDGGGWRPQGSEAADLPTGSNSVRIEGIGEFNFEASDVETLRPDIFEPGRSSLFDVLAHLDEKRDIRLEYHFSEEMNTHVVDSIDGESGWWHSAYYSGGWAEANSFRMDMYPYKNGMELWLHRERDDRLTAIHDSFHAEVDRLASNGGRIIIPEVTIRSPSSNTLFRDVEVTPHDVRTDVLQPGVVTGLDAILSLAEQGELSRLKLTWYERIGTANPVQSYWLEQIDQAEASGTCGFVYETGARGIGGNHIHVPSDVRVTVSPEYALWFWICL